MKTVDAAPESYIQLRNLMENPNSNIDDFSAVVSCDPQLTSAVLKVVNSAFFGLPGHVDSIAKAINLIGIGQLYDMVLDIYAINSPELTDNSAYTPVVSHFTPAIQWA